MGPPSYIRSVVDRNVIMRRVSVFINLIDSVLTSNRLQSTIGVN